MPTSYFNHLAAQAGPDVEPESAPNAVERFHDHALFTFLEAATDLANFGYTAGQLARLVERHLTPQVVPFPEGTVDPFKGDAA